MDTEITAGAATEANTNDLEVSGSEQLETEGVTEGAASDQEPLPVDIEKLKSLTPAQRQKFFDAIGDLPLEYQVNGKKVEKSFKDIRKLTQKELAADEKFQQASERFKKAEMFFQMLQQDPAGTLQKMGFDVDQLATQRVRNLIEQESMDPRERELLRERAEKEALAQQLHQRRLQEEQARNEAEKQKKIDYYKKAIPEALKTHEIPVTDFNQKRVAQYLAMMKKNGWSDATVEDAAGQMAEDLKQELQQYFAKGDPGHAIKVLGKEFVEKMRKHALESIPNPETKTFKKAPSGTSAKQGTSKKKRDDRMSMDEWRARLDSIV